MCLIVNFEPKYTISQELMDNFAKRNNDGYGFMWIQDNRLCHMKFGPDKMQDLYAMYQSVKDYSGFLHLRMRTHGNINQDMAHPFNCGFGIYMMHNGVLDDKGEDKSKSDTWNFVNNILNPLFKQSKNPHRLIRSTAFSDLIHKYLGYSNRVVIGDRGGWQLFNSNTWVTIKNEKTGCKGMLVSNSYAWNEDSFGRAVSGHLLPAPRSGGYYYGHVIQDAAKAVSVPSNSKIMEDDDDEDIFPISPRRHRRPQDMKQSVLYPAPNPRQVEEFLQAHFFTLGRAWYADAYGKVFKKRPDGGLDRRADLDESEQFWDTFDADLILSYGEWISEKQNLDIDTTRNTHILPVGTKEDKPKPSQLVLNWANKSPDQIKEDLAKFPDQAADAIVALTHEPIHQVQ
jgi:hypothetical protein